MNALQALRRGVALSSVLLGACAAAGPASAPVDQAWADVLRLRGDTACSNDAQCHSIGVGNKACGGPADHLAWSSQHSDGVALAAAVQRHAALQMAGDKVAGRMSTCAITPDPGAVCKAGNATDKTKRCGLQQR